MRNKKRKNLRSVDDWERAYYNKKPLRRKIVYRCWSIYYYCTLRISIFLRRLADKIDRL